MRWKRGRRSADLEVRRGGRGMGAIGAGLGVPGVIIFLLIQLLGGSGEGGFEGIDDVLGGLENPRGPAAAPAPEADSKLVDFMSFVLDDVQGFWADTFAQSNKRYERAKLVIFEGATQSACGGATSEVGPHYCPADNNVYLDLDFFRELSRRFGAPGDFAQAYVLAHEIGHHVQNVLGINTDVARAQQQDPDRVNDLSVRLELQADCFAGVWAFTTYERDLLERGDLEEGLTAAAAVGDDRIQEQAGQDVNPETWTHGSAEQRMAWFRRGYENGDPNDCDTFSAEEV